jgi:hypothetical protein
MALRETLKVLRHRKTVRWDYKAITNPIFNLLTLTRFMMIGFLALKKWNKDLVCWINVPITIILSTIYWLLQFYWLSMGYSKRMKQLVLVRRNLFWSKLFLHVIRSRHTSWLDSFNWFLNTMYESFFVLYCKFIRPSAFNINININ